MLEILTAKAQGTKRGNIVFVHGAWHGAWCWEDNFLPFFAGQGYDCYAPSLRGHAGSPTNKNLRWVKIADYVEDVWSVVKDLEGDTYIMGHSMGGYVVQKFLETHGNSIKKAVLIASVPNNGAKNKPVKTIEAIGFWSFMKMNFTLALRPVVDTPEKVRTIFFDKDTPQYQVNTAAERVENEAFLAYLDILNKKYIQPDKIKTPLLVVSAGKD